VRFVSFVVQAFGTLEEGIRGLADPEGASEALRAVDSDFFLNHEGHEGHEVEVFF